MGYFDDQCDKLEFRVKEQEGMAGLRECQMGAFWAACAHFTHSDSPALIVMPTGSGKTAVMMLLAFGLSASRALVITPAVILRDQIAKKFKSLDDLVTAGVLLPRIKKPKVHIQEGRITSKEMWSALRGYDVVVATPHTVSPGQHRDIVPAPDDLFDIVFFDEAHHTPARTWNDLLKEFQRARRILLTATPFREDWRPVRADMVYRYPLGRAIDRGIYQPIEYHPIRVLSKQPKDVSLCKKAKELLAVEKENSRRTKILIRTDRVGKSERLIQLYRTEGIGVGEVNYSKSLKENKAVLDAIRRDKLDGVVCVGMLGEGLDIPELKIAVLHDPPQSLPYTLQFIGRICRPVKGQIGDAHVVADPDDVKGRMRELYRQEARWRDLVPRLVNEAVGRVAKQSKFHQAGSIAGDLDIDPKEIAPFFSARLYAVEPKDLTLGMALDLGDEIDIPFVERLDNGNFLVLITVTKDRPPWAKSLAFYLTRYDLHLYYYHRASRTLFESTTSDAIARQIRGQVVKGEPQRRGGEDLLKVMQDQESVNYLMVGLANVLRQSPSLPTYKILMGKETQGAVRPTEGRVFAPGHALARVSREETRGIANFQGRVWAIKRASLMEYKDWCDIIGYQLVRHKVATTYPEMEFLSSPQRVDRFPDRPIAVVFDYGALGLSLKLLRTHTGYGQESLEISSPEFQRTRLSKDCCRLLVDFYPDPSSEGVVPLVYDITGNRWTVEGKIICKVRVDTEVEVRFPTLEEFLSEYPPFIYLRNGGMIRNGELFQPKLTYSALPQRCFRRGIDWSSCDITVESADITRGILPANGKKAIHDFLEEKLRNETSKDAVVLKDHGRGEIADYVVIDPRDKTIALYHCKASSKAAPGARISDLSGVLEQVVRSVHWLWRINLVSEVVGRASSESRPDSRLVKGTSEMGENLAKRFGANDWEYLVVIVQPGLDCRKAVKWKNTNTLLLSCFEWISNLPASLLIMGH